LGLCPITDPLVVDRHNFYKLVKGGGCRVELLLTPATTSTRQRRILEGPLIGRVPT
jgi:hypothetical protein